MDWISWIMIDVYCLGNVNCCLTQRGGITINADNIGRVTSRRELILEGDAAQINQIQPHILAAVTPQDRKLK